MSDRGFYMVFVAGNCGRLPHGYRLLFAEIGRKSVRLLDPFTLDTGKMDLRAWIARRPEAYQPRKGIIRRAIKRNLEQRARTELVKSCLSNMKAAH